MMKVPSGALPPTPVSSTPQTPSLSLDDDWFGEAPPRKKKRQPLSLKAKVVFWSCTVIVLSLLGYFFGYAAPAKSPSYAGLSAMSGYISSINDGEYIKREYSYASTDLRKKFVSAVVGTVDFDTKDVRAKNLWGIPAVHPFTLKPIMEAQDISPAVDVDFRAVDYSAISFGSVDWGTLVKTHKITKEDFEYSAKITDAYAEVLSQMTLPTKTVTRKPNMECSETDCTILPSEDEFWDTFLFSSEEFVQSQKSFSEGIWEYLKGEKGKAPSLEPNWIGSYELKDTAPPRSGEGTQQSPAGVGTPVKTKYGEQDIEVTLVEFSTDEKAFKALESKSPLNRGFTVDSSVKYAYMKFKIRNLSNSPLTVEDQSVMTDAQRTNVVRVGTVYGLTTRVEGVAPGDVAEIESWSSSTSLPDYNLIWGKNSPTPVWFKRG